MTMRSAQGKNGSIGNGRTKTTAPKDASDGLANGDKEEIDRTLNVLNVSTTNAGQDQSRAEDTEGSNSSSKHLDKQEG